jgi:penicillin-binding protein 2
MFVFDRLKGDSGRLRPIAVIVAAGMFVLLGGLWFVQIVYSKRFQNNLIRQSYRTVRIPAIRGKILDRNGNVLADDQPHYNAILYLEDLQGQFDAQYVSSAKMFVKEHPEALTNKGRTIPASTRHALHLAADCAVVSNITRHVSTILDEPRILNTNGFLRHYNDYPYVPFQLVPNLGIRQVAMFSEQLSGQPALELETQPVRFYPHGTVAANLIGYVQRRDEPISSEISFTMPDFQGRSGVERVYDEQLRGKPGEKSVLVNNLNYRQREHVENPNQPGNDVYLTIDLDIQKAAERALASAQYETRGAVIVMDPRNGDLIALASAPTFDPNEFVPGLTQTEAARLDDKVLTPQLNRAVSGTYPPGSTFKIITSIACLESGLDPEEIYDSRGYYQASPTSRRIGDTAGPGKFNFKRAFYRSSNPYFIHYGSMAGLRKILEVAHRFHLGEKTRISTGQEPYGGTVPASDSVGFTFPLSSTPDVCIGQEITITPLQMACMVSVIANGGTLYWPRVVSHSRSPDTGETTELVTQGRVRDHVQINPRHLEIIRQAMLADTEQAENSKGELGGTAYTFFHNGHTPDLSNFRVAGKTGTAEVKSAGSNYKHVTWFTSYGPFENPRYVIIVMVEDGRFGGPTCAPVAEKIYEAIMKKEQNGGIPTQGKTFAQNSIAPSPN